MVAGIAPKTRDGVGTDLYCGKLPPNGQWPADKYAGKAALSIVGVAFTLVLVPAQTNSLPLPAAAGCWSVPLDALKRHILESYCWIAGCRRTPVLHLLRLSATTSNPDLVLHSLD